MGQHQIKHFIDETGKHGCRCQCGWAPPDRYESRQLVEDQVIKHEALVARARASLKPRSVSLLSERDWYLERASDYNETAENRELWQRMADELTVRIGGEKGEGQTELW